MPATKKKQTTRVDQIVSILKRTPDASRKDIAAKVGCSTGLVAAVIGGGGANYTPAKYRAWAGKDKPKKAAAKHVPATVKAAKTRVAKTRKAAVAARVRPR